MNDLNRPKAGILGTESGLDVLERAETARLLVLSDTHGHYPVLESVIRKFGPDCDALLFAGDGMWDIIQYVENAQKSEKLRSALPPVVAFVAGNGDGDLYRVSLPVSGDALEPEDAPGYTLSVPSRQIIRACGYGIFLAHGHRHSVDVSLDVLVDSAHAMDCDIAVYGHTHIPLAEQFSHILTLNSGSISRPRGRSEPSFAIVELDAATIVPRVTFCTVTEGVRGNYNFKEIPFLP